MGMPASSCFLCGGAQLRHWSDATDQEYFTTPESFSFYECASCKVLRIQPVPADRLATIYPPDYYSFDEPAATLVERVKGALDRRMFRRVLGGLRGDRLKVLDVGGGSGWMLDVARSASERVRFTQVVDLDAGAEAAARRRGHAYFCGRIEDFSTTERFDLIIMLNLIEHVADPVQVLRQARSLLTEQGVVLVKTPNYDALDARLFRHGNWAGFHCPRHWVLFTRESFGQAARTAGLQVRSVSYTQGAPFWAASLLAQLHRRGLVRLGPQRPAFRHPLFAPLLVVFAAFDLMRRPLAKTSQMFIVLGRDADGSAPASRARQA